MGSNPWNDPYNPHHAFVIAAVFSCFLSLLVVITYLLFPRLRNKLFMKIITMISLCDCIANSTELNGMPQTRELCVAQAMVLQFFYPASWMWTVILTYLLYSLATDGKISLPEWKMHLIVWGTCTAITLLPFTSSTYGQEEGDHYWCYIQPTKRVNNKAASDFWQYLTFDCMLFGCFLLMTLWGTLIFYKQRTQQIVATKMVRTAIRTLFVYPIVLLFTWFPNAFLITLFPSYPQDSTMWIIFECLSIWQGGLTAIVFFRNSRESRMLWYGLLIQCCKSRLIPQRPSIVTTGRESELSGTRTTLTKIEHAPNVAIDDFDGEDFESDDAYYGRNRSSSQTSTDDAKIFSNTENPIWSHSDL